MLSGLGCFLADISGPKLANGDDQKEQESLISTVLRLPFIIFLFNICMHFDFHTVTPPEGRATAWPRFVHTPPSRQPRGRGLSHFTETTKAILWQQQRPSSHGATESFAVAVLNIGFFKCNFTFGFNLCSLPRFTKGSAKQATARAPGHPGQEGARASGHQGQEGARASGHPGLEGARASGPSGAFTATCSAGGGCWGKSSVRWARSASLGAGEEGHTSSRRLCQAARASRCCSPH